MSNGNSITITGNLTRDPELRFTASGQANASFGVAVNRRWQSRQTNEWEESTSFFDVVCWGSLAENCAQSLTRGSRIVVNGRLEQRSWETQEGDKRSKVEIIADEVGPSLRWATVKIDKNERRTPDGGGSSRDGGSSREAGSSRDGGSSSQAGASNYAGSRSAPSEPAYDEEPF